MHKNRTEVYRCLQQAALELFRERGYDQTTAAEIAARAGVTERTFFRYFVDKREVLFTGADDLRAALVENVRQASDVAGPFYVVAKVLMEFDWESLGSREFQRQRHAVIVANPELLERDLSKHHSLANGLADALRQRGVKSDIAPLAARVGVQTFMMAYERWLRAGNKTNLTTICKRVVSRLATIVQHPCAISP